MGLFNGKLRATASVLAITAVAAACGGSGTSSTQGGNATGPGANAKPASSSTAGCDPSKVTLNLAYLSVGKPGVALATREMKAKYPGLKVQGSVSATTSYDQLSQTILANRAAGTDDNVIQVGLDQVNFWVDTYHPYPLNTQDLAPSYNRKYLALGAVAGKDYVAPFQVDFPVLMVNTQLTAKAGLGPNDVPTTSSQLIADAKKVKAVTGKPPVYYSPDSIPDWYAQALIQSAGGTFVDPSGQAGFDSPQGMEALGIYTELGKDGLEDPSPQAQALAEFQEGSLPYYLTATSGTALMAKAVGNKFPWTQTTIPVPDGGKPVLPTGGNGWMILSNDRCTVAYASQFVADLLAPSVITTSSRSYSYIPVDTSSLEQVLAEDKDKPQISYAESYAGTLTPWSGFPGTVTNKADTIIKTMVEKLVRGATPQSVVPSAASQINALAKNNS